MERYRRSERWLGAALAVAFGLTGLVVAARVVAAQTTTQAPPKREPKAVAKGAEPTQLSAMAEAQRSLSADLAQLRDQLAAVQTAIAQGQDEIRQHHDLLQNAMEQIKGMREEVRGLYVESSGLKGDIAQLSKQFEGLEGSLGSFRLNSGILIALVLVLQIFLAALMFRSRGQ